MDSVSQDIDLPDPGRKDIRLDALSDREWRVVDRRLREQDAPCVLGFIERVGQIYEALIFTHGRARWDFECRSLDEAITRYADPGGGRGR